MAYYTLPTDEIGASASVSLTAGTADANYPVTKVQNKNPADVFLTSSSGTDVTIVWDHGSAVDVQLFSLHHHNIPPGTNVRFRRGASPSGGSVDAAVPIVSYYGTGMPAPAALDVTIQAGYGSHRYSVLHIPSVAQKVGVGSAMVWSTKRSDLSAVAFPFSVSERHPSRVWETAMGVQSRYSLGVRQRRMSGQLPAKNTEIATWLALWRAAKGNVEAFLYWLDPLNSADGWLATFGADTHDLEYQVNTFAAAEFDIVELSYGQSIPTA